MLGIMIIYKGGGTIEKGHLPDIIGILSNISFETPLDEFLHQLLKSAIKLCPGFCGGSIVLRREDGRWRYVVWEGFSDVLGDISFDPDKDVLPRSEEPVVIDGIFEKAVGKIPDEVLEMYRRAGSERIKKTISVGLFDKRGIIGAIFLDSFQDVEVTRNMLSTLRTYGRIASIFLSMKLQFERENMYQSGVITSMLRLVEMRDPYSVGHSEKVAEYSVLIAKALKLSWGDIERIRCAALVHDLGKVAVPEFILKKPSRLSDEEMEIVKLHPVQSEKLISDFEWLEDIASVVRHHQERWDGTGYPDGLEGEKIPFESRILSIADALDAMTSDRAYRRAMDPLDALKEIERASSTHFDPYIVERSFESLKDRWR